MSRSLSRGLTIHLPGYLQALMISIRHLPSMVLLEFDDAVFYKNHEKSIFSSTLYNFNTSSELV